MIKRLIAGVPHVLVHECGHIVTPEDRLEYKSPTLHVIIQASQDQVNDTTSTCFVARVIAAPINAPGVMYIAGDLLEYVSTSKFQVQWVPL